ncbi:hypothetical protein BAUCODRAFT_151567 [Baudoinia panamericana UAMH 10762]|uniref:Uncharacterized protein n=1 Tax=Baudoinia panamericana (strain UAMH 10762) TaxID=717646 RepID=M2M744_BAUPA|nr:uncharacterized protein BAUCODRAFT_151567 [Baudoinia panamericana UAMH 10762]EMC92121.1 hypothetical protein BAUCODRAFT_151567 [Baudoinia panamericana UAMH 10762]
MSFFEDTPLFGTDIDSTLDIITWLGIGGAIAVVYRAFSHALWKLHHERSGRHARVKERAVVVFVAVAILSFIIVHWLRLQHRKLKLASWDEIQQWRQQLPHVPVIGKEARRVDMPFMKTATDMVSDLPDKARSLGATITDNLPSYEQMTDGARHGYHSGSSLSSQASEAAKAAGSTIDALTSAHPPSIHELKQQAWAKGQEKGREVKKHLWQKGKELADGAVPAAERGWHFLRRKAPQVAGEASEGAKHIASELWEWFHEEATLSERIIHRFPWIEEHFVQRVSIWDFFKSLLEPRLRYFWTQQWLAGYITWSIFVGLESRYRKFTPGTALAFMVLSWCFSLATMQSLYFALILLRPDTWGSTRQRYVPTKMLVLLPTVAELLILVWLPDQLHRGHGDRMRVLNALQTILMVGPWIMAEVLQTRVSGLLSSRFGRGYFPTKARRMLRTTWYIIGICCIVGHSVTIYAVFFRPQPSSKSWLSWNERHKEAASVRSLVSVLTTFGDHPWHDAVCWDVLLSALTLSIWAAVSSSNVSEMIQCAVWPWLEETVDEVKGLTDYYYDSMRDNFEMFKYMVEYEPADNEADDRADVSWWLMAELRKFGLNAEHLVEGMLDGRDHGLEHLHEKGREAVESAVSFLWENRDVDRTYAHQMQREQAEMQALGWDGEDRKGYREMAWRARRGGLARTGRGVYSRQASADGDAEVELIDDKDEEDGWAEDPRKKARSIWKRGRGRPPKTSRSPSAEGRKQPVSRKSSRFTSRSPAPSRRASSRSRTRANGRPENGGLKRVASSGRKMMHRMQQQLPPTANLRVSRETVRDAVNSAEGAVLAWGFFVVGGLGLASVSVYGADEIHQEK